LYTSGSEYEHSSSSEEEENQIDEINHDSTSSESIEEELE